MLWHIVRIIVVSKIKAEAFLRKSRHIYKNFLFVIWFVLFIEFAKWSTWRAHSVSRNWECPTCPIYIFFIYCWVITIKNS